MERQYKRTDVSHKSCTANNTNKAGMTIKFGGDKWGTRNARSRNNFMVMPLCRPCNSELLCQMQIIKVFSEEEVEGTF